MAGHLHKSYALNHFWCADDSYHNINAMYTVDVLTMPVTTYTQYSWHHQEKADGKGKAVYFSTDALYLRDSHTGSLEPWWWNAQIWSSLPWLSSSPQHHSCRLPSWTFLLQLSAIPEAPKMLFLKKSF